MHLEFLVSLELINKKKYCTTIAIMIRERNKVMSLTEKTMLFNRKSLQMICWMASKTLLLLYEHTYDISLYMAKVNWHMQGTKGMKEPKGCREICSPRWKKFLWNFVIQSVDIG